MAFRNRSDALLRAQLERAVPACALLPSGVSPSAVAPVELARALHELPGLAARISSSRANQFKLVTTSGARRLDFTKVGARLLALLAFVIPQTDPHVEMLKLHPHTDLLIETTKRRLGWHVNQLPVSAPTLGDPDWWAAQLNGMVDELRGHFSDRAHFERLDRYKHRRAKAEREVKSYLRKSSKTAAMRHVVRLELYEPTATFELAWQKPTSERLRAHLREWLSELRQMRATTSPPWCWKIDYGPADGFFAHVLMLLSAPTEHDVVGVELDLVGRWTRISGGGTVLNCGDLPVGFESRGRPQAGFEDTLQQECDDASLFLAWADANWMLRSEPHEPALYGVGTLPSVRASLRPKGVGQGLTPWGPMH
jgi:hypothetical protein